MPAVPPVPATTAVAELDYYVTVHYDCDIQVFLAIRAVLGAFGIAWLQRTVAQAGWQLEDDGAKRCSGIGEATDAMDKPWNTDGATGGCSLL